MGCRVTCSVEGVGEAANALRISATDGDAGAGRNAGEPHAVNRTEGLPSGGIYFGTHSECLSNSARNSVTSNVLEVGTPVRKGVNSKVTLGTFSNA